MKSASKVGVFLLALVIFAGPSLIACLAPTVTLTVAERECCKQMAGQCGKMGMDKSHSCCQMVRIDDLNFVKAKSSQISPEMQSIALHAAVPAALVVSVGAGAVPFGAGDHSPPESPPSTVSILRI